MRLEPGPRQRKGPLREGGALGRSGGEARIRTGGKGFAGLCLTTWPLRRRYEKGRFENRPDACDGADNGARTRDPNLGKVVLYQLSHVRLRVLNIRDAAGGRKDYFEKVFRRPNFDSDRMAAVEQSRCLDTPLLQIFILILAVYLIARGIIWLVQRYHDARGCGTSFKNLLREGKLDANVYVDAVWSEVERFGKHRLRSKIAKRQRKLIRSVKNELRDSYLNACTPSLYQYVIIFLISSILGLLLETIYTFVVFGVFESRAGLVWGPFSPLYGCGAVLLTALLWGARDWPAWKIFFISAAVGGLLEQFTGWTMEHLAHAQSWTYLGLPDHISQWVAWRFLAMWGLVGLVWCRVILPELLYRIGEPTTARQATVVALLAVFIMLDAGMTVACFLRASARADGVPPANPVDVYLDTHYGDRFMQDKFENMRIGQDLPPAPR